MNTTLKIICSMLRSDDEEIQHSAAVVLRYLSSGDAGVIKAVSESLGYAHTEKTAAILLNILQKDPHEQSIRFLLEVLQIEVVPRSMVLDTIAGVGAKSVAVLRKLYDKASPDARIAIAEIMPRVKTDSALSFMVELFHSPNHEVARAAVHSLREQIATFSKKERAVLYARLKSGMNDKRHGESIIAIGALLIALGISAEIKSKKLMLPYVKQNVSPQIRRQALKSLAMLDYAGEGHGDALKALIPLLDESDPDIIRQAVDILVKIKPRKSDVDALMRILKTHKFSCVQAYVIRALSKLNQSEYVSVILEFVQHQDHNLQQAARESLEEMSAATQILVKHLDGVGSEEAAIPIIGILACHRDRLPANVSNSLAKKMFKCRENGERSYLVYRLALLELDGKCLYDSVMSRVNNAVKKNNYNAIRANLEILKNTPFLDEERTFRLIVAKFKTSHNRNDLQFRQQDYALELISQLLHRKSKEFVRQFLEEKVFEPEDYLYVGLHFMEKLHEERRFGVDCLQHVAKKWARSKFGKQAREILKPDQG